MMPQNTVPYLLPFKTNFVAPQTIRTVHVSNLQNLVIPMDQQICFQAPTIQEEDQGAVVYQVVYPEDLDLKPSKRGRPKRKKVMDDAKVVEKTEVPVEPPKTARTRSGRLVKLPKHIEKDFKKIEINDEPELKTSEFVRFEEKKQTVKLEELETHQKKRTISSKYRCPKCQKAYLGDAKMIQHLQKYPDHGPLSDKLRDVNFDVWNYLVDVTQKSPPGKRGFKFCEELKNLLHNVQILTNALFKKEESENNVQIDKVLGNAIGLNPGKYKFVENQLYKDVTVLKLIASSDFFNMNNQSNVFQAEERLKNVEVKKTAVQEVQTNYFNESMKIQFQTDVALEDFSFNDSSTDNIYSFDKKSDHQMESLDSFDNKKSEDTVLDNRIGLHSDLLLNALPHSSVDEFISVVDATSNMLDNSIASDEVMNVDQFVNERFKKLTEPDADLSNSSLNLDLPTLDLFQFNTS